jgi:hypothetical protein
VQVALQPVSGITFGRHLRNIFFLKSLPGTDVLIDEIFFPKNLAKNVFLTQSKAKF